MALTHENKRASRSTKIDYLTLEEEMALVQFYQFKIQDVCKHFQFPHHVQVQRIISMICVCV